jgi:hypothetical protein
MAADDSAEKGRLSSWKEISAFLGVDIRTCQRWEKKFGLPVQRIGNSAKSRVFAVPDELKRWREGVYVNGQPPAEGCVGEPPQSRPRHTHRITGFVSVASLALLIGAFIILSPGQDHQTVDFRIDGSVLLGTNKQGRVLWSFDTKLVDLQSEESIRKRFQVPHPAVTGFGIDFRSLPSLLIGDFNGDEKNETLFAPADIPDLRSGRVFYLDERGRELWQFDTKRSVTTGGVPYPPESVVRGIFVKDFNGDKRKEVLIISHTRMRDPTRVLLLDLEKNILGEYWHFGQISDIAIGDIDGDGRPELLCSGQNNSGGRDQHPCFFILNPRNLRGAGPVLSPEFRIDGMSVGSELVYVLLPLTPLEQQKSPGIAAIKIEYLDSGRIQVYVDVDNPIYEFDKDGRILTVTLGHSFRRLHETAVQAGKLAEAPDYDRLCAELKSGVRYFDGKAQVWVEHFAWSNPR